MSVELIDSSNLLSSILDSDNIWLDRGGVFKRIPRSYFDSFRVFNIRNYGAKVDGRVITGLNTTNGSSVVTADSAAFTSSDIGKVIELTTLVDTIVTTIASYQSSTQITLSAGVTFTTSVANCHIGTDDTQAWKDTINACAAAKGGYVIAPRGISIVNGPLITDQNGNGNPNSQIPLPVITPVDYGGKPIGIKILGESPPPSTQSGLIDLKAEAWDTCSIIKSTIRPGFAGRCAVFGTIALQGQYGPFNPIDISLENLWIRTTPDGSVGGANFFYAMGTQFRNVTVDRTATGTVTTDPSVFDSYGLIGGQTNGGTMYSFHNTLVTGFKRGYFFGEHTTGDNVQAMCCLSAFAFQGGAHHLSLFGRLCAYWCKNSLEAEAITAGYANIRVAGLSVEFKQTGKWFDSQYGVLDPGNKLYGDLVYHHVSSAVGADQTTFAKSGGTNLKCTSLYDL